MIREYDNFMPINPIIKMKWANLLKLQPTKIKETENLHS